MIESTPRARPPAPRRRRKALFLALLLAGALMGGALVMGFELMFRVDGGALRGRDARRPPSRSSTRNPASTLTSGAGKETDAMASAAASPMGFTKIPKIIHQTWKTSAVPQWALPTTQSWRDLNPGYTYRMWDDASAERLIREQYPELVPAFEEHMAPVQRADVFRYAVVHAYGGVYADIDVRCDVPVDDWLRHDLFNLDMVLGWEALSNADAVRRKHFAVEYQLCQWTFAAAPGNWLLRAVIDDIVAYYDRKMHEESASIIRSTGPGMFSSAIQRALKSRFNVTFGEYPLTKDEMQGSGAARHMHVGQTMILPLESFGFRSGVRGGGTGAHRLVTHGFRGSWKAAYKEKKAAIKAAKVAETVESGSANT